MSGGGLRGGGHRALSDCYGMEKDYLEHATGARMKPRPGRTGQAIAEKVHRHGGELALRAGFADDSHRMLCMEESFGLSGAGAGSMGKMPPSRAAGYDAALPVSGMLAQLWRERTEGALREDVEGDMAGAGIGEGASARNLEAHLSHLEQAVSSRYVCDRVRAHVSERQRQRKRVRESACLTVLVHFYPLVCESGCMPHLRMNGRSHQIL